MSYSSSVHLPALPEARPKSLNLRVWPAPVASYGHDRHIARLLIYSSLRDAKKLRSKIIRDIEQLKKGINGKSEEEQLKKLEEGIAQYVYNRFVPNYPWRHV